MASPKKKWLRIKAAEDAVKAEAKVAETARLASEAKAVKQAAEAHAAKQAAEAKAAATKVSAKKSAPRRRSSISED